MDNSSNIAYRFGARAIPVAYTQDEVNHIVAESGLKVYDAINKNWTYCDDMKNATTSADYWKISIQIIPHISYCSDDFKGFASVLYSPAQVECMTARDMSKIFALLELLGEEKFSLLIKQTNSLLSELPQNFVTNQSPEKSTTGSYLGISNIHAYKVFKPRGPSCNHNVLCVGEDLYAGFDPTSFGQGAISKEAILRALYNDFVNSEWLSTANFSVTHKEYVGKTVPDFESFLRLHAQQKNDTEAKSSFFDAQKINHYLQHHNLDFPTHNNDTDETHKKLMDDYGLFFDG